MSMTHARRSLILSFLAALLTACAASNTVAADGPVPPGAVARLGRGAITVLAADPSGEALAAGTRVGLTLYDAHTLDQRWQVPASDPVSAAAFSTDGAYLAVGLESGLAIVLSAEDGQPVDQVTGPDAVTALAWGAPVDDKVGLALGFSSGALLFTSARLNADGQLTLDPDPAPPVRDVSAIGALAFSPNGTIVAEGNHTGSVNLWDPESGQLIETLAGHRLATTITALAWTPDGTRLVSAATDRTAIVWNPSQGALVATLDAGEDLLTVAASDSRILTADAAGIVTAWALDGARIGGAGPLAEGAEAALVASTADAVTLFSHADGTLGRWQIGSGGNASRGLTVTGHWPAADHALAVDWSPDGRWIASSAGSRVLLWDAETRALSRTLDAPARIEVLAFSPVGATLAAGSADRSITLWDVASGEQTATLTGHRDAVAALAWSPDGARLASAGSLGDRVIVWDVDSGEALARLTAGAGGVFSVAWSPDGTRLAAGLNSGQVWLWEVSGESIGAEPVEEMEGHSGWVGALAWSPDGQFLASGAADGQIAVYDREDGSSRRFTDHAYVIRGLAFSPDGTRLASAAQDERVIVWDLAAGSGLPLTGHTDGVNAVAWSPDGTLLASASDDGTVVLWEVSH